MSTHRVRVLARPEQAAGFALAGLPVTEVRDGVEAGSRLGELAREGGVGLVLIDGALHAALPDEARRRLARQPLPMVVPFPGPGWGARAEAETYLVELLRQAIGYRVRLR